jgi:tRNA/rRNA methyltransferase
LISPPPIIVLVRPQLGENIGKAARAMLNFGLTELRLVAPRDGWPNPSAGPSAAGADSVIADAKVYATLADAVADCVHVYATTVRKRGVTKPVITPEAAANTIITVPINPEFGSLNLAQAVILCAYEWSKHKDLVQPPIEDLLPPAPQAEFEGLFDQLTAMLEPLGYFEPEIRAATTRRTLRSILTKPAWNHYELRTLRGVLTTITRKPRP